MVNTLPIAGRLLVVLGIVYVLALGIAGLGEKATRTALASVLVPLGALLAMGIVQPVYFYRPVQPIAIAFCLLAGIVLVPRPGWHAKIAPAIGVSLLLISLSNWSPSARGGDIDQGAEVISRNWHPADRIVYASLTVAMPFLYYLPDRDSCLIPNNAMGALPPALRAMADCSGFIASGEWLVWPRDPTLDKDLEAALGDAVQGALPVWRSDIAWQFAPIEIYYLP